MSQKNKQSKAINWPLYFGGFFFLLVFVFGMQWLTTEIEIEDWMKVTLGILASALVGVLGITLQQVSKSTFANLFGQSLIALGFGGMIVSLLYGGFAYDFYPREVTALLTGAISIGWILYSYFNQKRILLNLSLTSMYAVPIAWGTDQVWPVFIYLLVTHALLTWTANRNKWIELNVLTNVFAWSMLLIYAIGVGTQTEWLGEPLFILIASLLYLRILTWLGISRSADTETSFIYYRPLIDIGFSILSILIFFGWFIELDPDYAISIYIAIIGISHGITGQLLPHLARPSVRFYQTFLTISAIGHLLLASLVLNATLEWELKTHILMIIWCILAYALSLIPRNAFRYTAWGIWLYTVLYGFTTTWTAPIGEWFGVFIPFLNTGAMSWIVTAFVGYRFISSQKQFNESREFSVVNTIITCLIIGGLLIVQTDNAFEAYGWSDELYQIVLSGVLGLYALSWFVFSVFIKQRWMELISVVLLAVVGLKAIFVDLWNSEPFLKMIVFALLGMISFLMLWIDRKVHASDEA